MTASLAGGKNAGRPAARVGTWLDDAVPDAQIAAWLLQGDDRWLALAHRRWSHLVQAYAWRVLGDAREAEDVAQHVFVAAWRGRAGFRPDRGTLPAWLMGITRRKTADALSARTRRLELVAAAGRQRCDETVEGPEQVIDRIVTTRELALLPRVQRDVLALAYFADLTQVQIADRTGMPLGTVKSHARRGMQRLRLRVAAGAAESGY
ncbi:sigma-70 family RNA polymerase sigma factor [Streptomyces sp. NPDC060020]|uniref:sigma-70 family RNA polymerase sigma factor n=1 Tax=Streptomyces sp. NPDC060020 TaxID=3347038 RepID=UPI0036C52EB1